MTNGEICRNFRTTIGTDMSKINRLRELNPCLSKEDIIGILQMDGINIKLPRMNGNQRFTREEREAIRRAEEERLKKPFKERESRNELAKRFGISGSWLAHVVQTTEADYERATDNK